jgi:hypothetical protein
MYKGSVGTSTLEVKGAALSRLILIPTAVTVREPASGTRTWSTVLEERAPGYEREAGLVGLVGVAMNFGVVHEDVVCAKLQGEATKSP